MAPNAKNVNLLIIGIMSLKNVGHAQKITTMILTTRNVSDALMDTSLTKNPLNALENKISQLSLKLPLLLLNPHPLPQIKFSLLLLLSKLRKNNQHLFQFQMNRISLYLLLVFLLLE